MMRVIKCSVDAPFLPRSTFLLAGQSNMSGRGLLSELPLFDNASRVKVYSNAGLWVGGVEPVDIATGQVDAVSADMNAAAGPSMAFGNAMAGSMPGTEIGLVPCAKGASSITQWARSLSRSTLYGSMIARAKEAQTTGQIRGMIFYQGESDTVDEASATAWSERCYALIDNIRSDLGQPSLPVIVTILGPDPGDPAFPYWEEVQNAQSAMTGANLSVVSASDLTAKVGDLEHLNAASQVVLGERYATAMHSLLA